MSNDFVAQNPSGQWVPLETNAGGTLLTTGGGGGSSTVTLAVGGPVGVTGAAVPADAIAAGFSNAGGSLTIPSATNPLPVVLGSGGGTQPVSGTVALSAGTANIGHVDGQGTAGAPAGGVVSVQGVSGGQAVPVLQATSVPTAATATAITTGGTATVIATGPWKGGWIKNPLSATDQNISAAENAYVNMVTTATANGRGSNLALYPGDSLILPPVSSGVTLSAIAATTGHAFSVEIFV